MSFEQLIKQTPGIELPEQDFRLQILNTLLETPHKNWEPYLPIFKHVAKVDPRFFVRLAAWYSKNGTVRDLQQLFCALLSVSAHDREVGLALLEELPPFQVCTVLHLIKNYKTPEGAFAPLAKSVPNSFRKAVKQYLYKRESDPKMFESAVIRQRKFIKTLYASLSIQAGEYASQVLFHNNPAKGSRLEAVKLLQQSKDVEEQARLIVDFEIPYPIACTLVGEMSLPILAALVSVMTPSECSNTLKSMEERGATQNKDLLELIKNKLKKGKGDSRVSAGKTREAAKHSGASQEITQALLEMGDARTNAGRKIKRSTALLVDKSGSMHEAIEAGKQLASIISASITSQFTVMAFDTIPMVIKTEGTQRSHWEKAFQGITANGGTSIGAPMRKLMKDKTLVEQVIIITDQAENEDPMFVQAYLEYKKQINIEPHVFLVNVGSHGKHLEAPMKRAGIQFDTFTITSKGDYYSFDSLVPMLAGGSRLDLLDEIMEFELPKRKPVKASVPTAAGV